MKKHLHSWMCKCFLFLPFKKKQVDYFASIVFWLWTVVFSPVCRTGVFQSDNLILVNVCVFPPVLLFPARRFRIPLMCKYHHYQRPVNSLTVVNLKLIENRVTALSFKTSSLNSLNWWYKRFKYPTSCRQSKNSNPFIMSEKR